MKKIFVIDWILLLSFLLSAVSGIGLHTAGHGEHYIWHNWAVFHVIASLMFLTLTVLHVKTHLQWYKSLIKNGIGNKSKVTVFVTFLFALLAITGLILLGVEGGGSGIGLWHYRIGLLSLLFFCGHIIKRLPILKKSVKAGKKPTAQNAV